MPAPTNPNPVVTNLSNTLGMRVFRLPLGIPQADPGGLTYWRIWIPTDTGGTLQITHDHSALLTLSKNNPVTGHVATGTGTLTYEVPIGEYGAFVVAAGTGRVGTIGCTFKQKGWSRVDQPLDAAPLVPWNFYYWPSSQPEIAARSRAVMKRYATAVGKDGDAAEKWELDNHQPAGADGWAGHCHNAAPASALFKPIGPKTISGAAFDEEEMELLAAELFGNYGMLGKAWTLGAPWTLPGTTESGRFSLPAYLKPGMPKTRAALVEGLEAELGPKGAQVADALIAQNGGEAQFATNMAQQMGQLAAKLYDALTQWMRFGGHPLVSNMRDYTGFLGSVPVWNQIFFHYEATYVETAGTNDDLDMTIDCQLTSNQDTNPSPGLPARIVNGEVVPTSGSSMLHKHLWRIIFSHAGKIDAANPRGAWKSLKNVAGFELYPPTELYWIDRLSATPRYRSDNLMERGNPYVGRELLAYLEQHLRYTL
ncbi:Hypothetical protein A7982_01336 [Minicystis rosea]|nr:Hypothetical protein A7982_01336 [Minicystis rosea]